MNGITRWLKFIFWCLSQIQDAFLMCYKNIKYKKCSWNFNIFNFCVRFISLHNLWKQRLYFFLHEGCNYEYLGWFLMISWKYLTLTNISVIHTLLILFQATVLNVAFNSHNKALLTIMMSNNVSVINFLCLSFNSIFMIRLPVMWYSYLSNIKYVFYGNREF